jgi:hypothetical protein
MFGKKPEIDLLVAAEKSDLQKLDALQRELDSLEPKWAALQTEAEILAAQFNAQDRTYSKDVAPELWERREARIKLDLILKIDERDRLTGTLPTDIRALKDRVSRRREVVKADFNGWVWKVAEKLPADSELLRDLHAVRQQCLESTDLAEITGMVSEWTARIEAREDVNLPLMHVGASIRRAAQVAA